MALGADYHDKGEYDKAIAAYTRAIDLNQDDADAYYLLGLIYLAQKEYGKAIANFDRAIKIAPNDADAYYDRDAAHDGLGDAAQAAQDRQKHSELTGALPTR